VDYDSGLHEPRTNGVQSETGGDFRVSFESRDDLYFIQAASGPVKIGRGRDPKKRLHQCRIGSHEQLTLLAVVGGRGYEERVWHRAFNDNRLRGEWFAFDDDLEEAIGLAVQGKNWWDHLWPPSDFEWIGEDEDELEEGVVDWHCTIQMALAALRDGEKPPLGDPNELMQFADERIVAFISAVAEKS